MLGDPGAAFCARCGHPAEHHQAETASADAEASIEALPCSRCDCPELLGDPGARFCARCGHPAADHRAARAAVAAVAAAACTDCDCGEFLGGPNAVFCARCGHAKSRHGANAAEQAEPVLQGPSGLDPEVAQIVDAKEASVVGSEQPALPVETAAATATVDDSDDAAPARDEPAFEPPTQAKPMTVEDDLGSTADSEAVSSSEPATEDRRTAALTDPTTRQEASSEQAPPPPPMLDRHPSTPTPPLEHDEPRESALAEQIRDDSPDPSVPLEAATAAADPHTDSEAAGARSRLPLILGASCVAILLVAVGVVLLTRNDGGSAAPALDSSLAVSGFTRGYVYPGAVTQTTTPIALSWNSVTGVCHYQIETTVDGATTTATTASSANSVVTHMRYGTPYSFRMRALGCSNTAGPWSVLPPVKATLVSAQDPQVAYTGTWKTAGSLKRSPAGSGTATLAFIGTNIAWIAQKDANSGLGTIRIDRQPFQTRSLYAATPQPFQLISKHGFGSDGSHQISIAPTRNGTINLQSFVVLSQPTG